MVTKHVAALDGPQKGLTHLAVGGPLILYSSSDGRVAGFSNTASSTGYEASYGVPASFEASLPVAINQLVRANTRPRYKRHQPKCVLRRDIIGTSLDGSMFSFSILEDNGYLLLKLVENMCHRHTKICPLALSAERHRPLEADREKPHELSINGNRLVELLQRRDAETIMKEMLDAPLVPGYYGSRPRDYERVEDRRRAAELLLKGLEEEASDDRRARQLSLERRILEYLIQVLEVPF